LEQRDGQDAVRDHVTTNITQHPATNRKTVPLIPILILLQLVRVHLFGKVVKVFSTLKLAGETESISFWSALCG